MRRLALLLPIVLVGCASGKPASAPAAPAVPSASTAPGGALTDELHWVRNAAEYRAVTIQTFRSALAAAQRAAAGRPPGSWAVSVDADETVIDNSQYEKELQTRRESMTDASWREWVKRRERRAVPGAAAFLTGVRQLGGRVAVVSNTAQSSCGDLAANLDALSLPYDYLLCRPDGEDGEKENRWKAIADGTARPDVGPAQIVVWVGDNIQDFPDLTQALRREAEPAFADFGVRYFALPNPIYGTWEKNPPE